jgi:hypothetical protein
LGAPIALYSTPCKMDSAEDRSHMKLLSHVPSAGWHCLVSVVSLGGSWTALNLWFTAGGWHRQQHWGDGTLWGASMVVGLWSAVDAMRLGRKSTPSFALLGLLLCVAHTLSLCLFLIFLQILAEGGARP